MPDARASVNSRVLLVTRNLPPLVGGMEKLNLHLILELRKKFQVAVVGPAGCAVHLPPGTIVKEVPHKPLWRFIPRVTRGALTLAREFRPDIVIAGSGLTAPMAFGAARACAASTIVYAHGLDIVARHPAYRIAWLPFLRRFDLCLANSRNTARLAAGIGIPESRIAVLCPAVNVPSTPDSAAASEFRRRHGLGSRKILLSVGRLTPRKGILEFVTNALPTIARIHPDTILVIIGNEAPDAATGTGTKMVQKIEAAARKYGVVENLRILGECDEAVLAAAYQAANLLVFPVRELRGDVEGFGMVAIEAAAFGLPTAAFSVGGVVDAIAEDRSGWLVPPSDYDALARRIIDVLAQPAEERDRERCIQFAAEFALPVFGTKLRKLINERLGNPCVASDRVL